jgi:hypothetical protein
MSTGKGWHRSEKKLKSAGLDLSSKEAWQILKTVRVVEIELGDDKQKRSVTQGSARAAQILRALGIKDLIPMHWQRLETRPHSDTCQNQTLYFQ